MYKSFEEHPSMSKSIYVGNIPYGATEDDVRTLFQQHGKVVSVKFINDRETGRFRGFCFVEMDNGGAETAIEALNGFAMSGRPLKVNEARRKEQKPQLRY